MCRLSTSATSPSLTVIVQLSGKAVVASSALSMLFIDVISVVDVVSFIAVKGHNVNIVIIVVVALRGSSSSRGTTYKRTVCRQATQEGVSRVLGGSPTQICGEKDKIGGAAVGRDMQS